MDRSGSKGAVGDGGCKSGRVFCQGQEARSREGAGTGAHADLPASDAGITVRLPPRGCACGSMSAVGEEGGLKDGRHK